MIQLYKGIPFSPQAELTEDIGAEDTVIKVSDVSAFPDGPNYATIGTDEGGETVLYAEKGEDSLSGCQRGVEGTAKAWKAGEVIARNFTAKDHNDLIEKAGEQDTALQAKADKAAPSTEGNVAELTADGNLLDSGKRLEDKQDKLTGQQGQVVGFDADGKAGAAEVGGTNLHIASLLQPYYQDGSSDLKPQSAYNNEKVGDFVPVVPGSIYTIQNWITTLVGAYS